MNQTFEKVIDIISSASGVDKSLVSENTPIGSVGINSITFIEIIVKVEQEFDIEIDDEDLDIVNFNTVGDLFKVIEKQL